MKHVMPIAIVRPLPAVNLEYVGGVLFGALVYYLALLKRPEFGGDA